jgi:hypothetical protein
MKISARADGVLRRKKAKVKIMFFMIFEGRYT